MKKRALRLILGAGYVALLTFLLLYQSGALGERREWGIATLTTLFLGVSLAAVLLLYLRVNDQVRRQGERQRAEGTETGRASEAEGTAKTEKDMPSMQTGREQEKTYEEIYAGFLAVMKSRMVSERELEVAWLLYRGYTNRQIGEELYIAETTVKKHVSHIYQKLAVYSRKEFRAYVQEAVVLVFTAQTDLPG